MDNLCCLPKSDFSSKTFSIIPLSIFGINKLLFHLILILQKGRQTSTIFKKEVSHLFQLGEGGATAPPLKSATGNMTDASKVTSPFENSGILARNQKGWDPIFGTTTTHGGITYITCKIFSKDGGAGRNRDKDFGYPSFV